MRYAMVRPNVFAALIVVAAGAVVISDVPPESVVAGCPAHIIKHKSDVSAAKTALVDALREL